MPTNIEIKARVRDWDLLRRKAEALADRPVVTIEQLDTFFAGRNGRLKLRSFSPTKGELIAYDREDLPGSKESRYVIAPTTEPDRLAELLGRALGVAGMVRKSRLLFMTGQTRIHLDDVEGLGRFVELEVVMLPDQPSSEGVEIARELMRKLGIESADLIAGAYVDLIAASAGSSLPKAISGTPD